MDTNRLAKELREIQSDTKSGVTVEVLGDNLAHMQGTLKGPEESPYEGGKFYVDIQLTNSYPFEAPKMRFITKVWHPNVSSANGAICLDILKDQWSPALSIKTAMLSLQALLSTPEPNDPQDAVVAKQYLDSYEEFVKHAKEWTAKYASENRKDEKEEKLKEMGFGEAAVRNALSRAAGDEQQALELLLTGL
uniref:E2 ubiquitin-conjugating enzyme n=2 Tax=Micromonas pusilla TaxID=38833 RepID=A0A7S0NN76_MICPS